MRNQNLGAAAVARVLMVSPLQNEMLRRNFSRVFITTAGESVIDSVLFQGYRPIEQYIEHATRAIQMAGLVDPTGDINLRPAFEHNATAGFMQQHLVSKGWLQNSDSEVCDLVIELELTGERLPDINMKTYNAELIEGSDENPLCIFTDIDDLYHNDMGELQLSEQDNQQQPVGQDNSGNDNQDDQRAPGGQGRVKDPTTDGRLRENRGENAMARRGGDSGQEARRPVMGEEVNGRMAGRPGRVARPWDGRLKANRFQAAGAGAEAGGR